MGGFYVTATPSHGDIPQLLKDWSDGHQQALTKLIPLVYDELRRLAQRYMAQERPDHTLQTTALVHEAYLRLVDLNNVRWQNRAHFFGVSAQLMRHILVDYARNQHAAKRGGANLKLSLDEAVNLSDERAVELVALDDAMARLASLDPQKSRIAELRFFGGLNIEEVAEILGVSAATVVRQWRLARAWLNREISKEVTSDA